MKRTTRISIRLCLTLVLAFSLVAPALGAPLDTETEQAVRDLIENQYYLALEGVDVQGDDLDVVLGALDRYSDYMTAEEFETFDSGVEGAFAGIGVKIHTTEDGVEVEGVLPGTPAEGAGMKIGDVFVSVDGRDVTGLAQKDLVGLLRGEIGEPVTVEVRRPGTADNPVFVLTRARIDVSGKVAELDEDGIARFRVNTFSSDVGGWFLGNLIRFDETDDLQGVLIDLRANPGGRLTAALGMSSAVLARDASLAKVYRQGELIHHYKSTSPGFFLPVVILANNNTASASEFVIASLTDNDAAELVGETTYGKGVIQTAFTLPNGDYLKLTTAEYKGPADTPIQGVGLVPDLAVADVPDEEGEEPFDEVLDAGLTRLRQMVRHWGPERITFVLEADEAFVGHEGRPLRTQSRLVSGRFNVPLRDACELLGLSVRYTDGTIRIEGDGLTMTCTPGSRTVQVNGEARTLPHPLLMENARTWLPLRFLGETLGYSVRYDAGARETTLAQ